MRVHVDPTKCQGYGQCHEVCPDVFGLDEWGYAEVSEAAAQAAEREPAILAAAAACPEGAIIVETSDATGVEEN